MVLEVHQRWNFWGRTFAVRSTRMMPRKNCYFMRFNAFFMKEAKIFGLGSNDDLMVHAMDEIGTCRRAGVDQLS
jgi:hypothetical protein